MIGYWRNVAGNLARVAEAFEVSVEVVEAALEYYRENQAAIDARLAANEAAFAA